MRTALSPLLVLALLGFTVANQAQAQDDFDDLDFGIDDENWDDSAEEEEADEDLFGFDSDPVEDFDVMDDDFDPYVDVDDDDSLAGLTDRLGPEDMAQAEPIQAGAKTATLRYDVVGKQPLADNYPVDVVAVERDAVVVELPVLLGRSRAGFEGDAYWLTAEVLSDGQVITSATQWVGRISLAEFGPSFAFFKMLTPVTASSGSLELRVSQSATPDSAGTPLFTSSVDYAL